MSVLQAVVLIAVAIGGTTVVLTREPLRQAMVVGIYGFMLALLFFVFQAPDVSLSEIVICTIALPIMILLALSKIRQHDERSDES
ncbi:MAG TPA: DUF4040 domain-containing protein [Candidatus Dormibacteraeota bacterium]|nr:DUF4040 domain-containing protein [Candidatus Dormibacteraeota bacterium]